MPRAPITLLVALITLTLSARAALAIDDEHKKQAAAMAEKAVAYLKSKQDKESGGWSVPTDAKKPHLPAITALAITGIASDPHADPRDGAVLAGAKYLMNFQQPDGGIYDRILPSYNTSISVSALTKVDLPQAQEAVKRAVRYLRGLQWGESADPEIKGPDAAKPVGREHPYYGGVGYGRHGRPDASNLHMFLQALQDAGVSPGDEAVKRAVVFMQRVQMDDRVNDMPFAKGSRQGGFVYATVEDAKSVDARDGSSEAGTIEETLDDGTKVSRLRAYGSMTYAGFKSYLYAELPRDDQRVRLALGWISSHYTLSENPNIGLDGLYYYYVTFARALKAWNQPTLEVKPADGQAATRDWANDLVDALAKLQNEDGSFRSVKDRWMENDPVLITSYALIALQEARK